MVHAKSDSEVTSMAPSSPARSPRPAAYYVQSPSRDSHDGEKTTASFHSSPVLSPTTSPPHSHSSIGHHSRDSSSTRFSASRKINPSRSSAAGIRSSGKPSNGFDAIEEEGLLHDDDHRRRGYLSRPCYFLVFVLAFSLLFSFFALILWGASRSQHPQVSMKSITFESFVVSAGTDASLVPTDMATLNSTVKIGFRNRGSFFGVHVSSISVDLSYYQLSLAAGDINEFYQSRKSQKSLSIVVSGNKIPLYGAAASLTGPAAGKNAAATVTATAVPLSLSLTVKSMANVLGKLVKTKFRTLIHCNVDMDLKKLNRPISLKNSCQIH